MGLKIAIPKPQTPSKKSATEKPAPKGKPSPSAAKSKPSTTVAKKTFLAPANDRKPLPKNVGRVIRKDGHSAPVGSAMRGKGKFIFEYIFRKCVLLSC